MNNLLVFLCAVGVFLSPAARELAARAPQYDAAAEQQLLQMLNQERTQRGLPPLESNPQLQEAARAHAALMAERQQLSHDFPNEPPLRDRLANTGLHFDRSGENVAFNQSVQAVHEGLMHSPPHRANILNPDYNAVGIGIVQRDSTLYVVEDFARTFAEYSASAVDEIVAGRVSELRGRAGLPPLGRRLAPQLDAAACRMARHDALDPKAVLRLPGVRQAAAFTSMEPQLLPPEAEQIVRQRSAKAFAVGACFARTRRYPAGAYWIVLVTY